MKSPKDQARLISTKLSALAVKEGIGFESLAMTFLIERMLARLVADQKLGDILVFKGGYVGLRKGFA